MKDKYLTPAKTKTAKIKNNLNETLVKFENKDLIAKQMYFVCYYSYIQLRLVFGDYV